MKNGYSIVIVFLTFLSFSNVSYAFTDKDEEVVINQMLQSPMDEVLANSVSNEAFIAQYSDFLKNCDIFISQPKGFNIVDSVYKTPYRFTPNKHHISKYYSTNGVSNYAPPYHSEDNEALLLFPLRVASLRCDIQIEDELMAALDDNNIDCTNFVSYVEDEKILKCCNADRIYYYEYDISPDDNKDFTHCIGLGMRKKNHPSFMIKLLLTDDGVKHKQKYIRDVLGCVRYGDVSYKIYEEEEKKLEKYGDEGKFPIKRVSNTGIKIERSVDNLNDFLKVKRHK